MTPRVHVYAVCWNEEKFLPYFLRHYSTFAEKIIIFDNESDDHSAEIARSFPNTSVETFSTGGQLRDDIHIEIKQRAANQSRDSADWVIVADADELIWHPDPLAYLARCSEQNVAVLGTHGYNMISDAFPTTSGQVYDEVDRGAASAHYSKPIVFAPKRVSAMNFQVGAHGAKPIVQGSFLQTESELKLLHFALLGLDYVLPRCEAKSRRLSDINRKNKWGEHYDWDEQRLTATFQRIRAAAQKLDFLKKFPQK